MPENWKWEQGRIQYFRFSSIRNLAYAITELENVELDNAEYIRAVFESHTNLPFSPSDYVNIWRNYGRVVKAAFLGARINNRLTPTDVCRRLVHAETESRWEIDEYMLFVIQRFSFPFPAFRENHLSRDRVYPFCALIKYLLANFIVNGEASISMQEVFSKLIGNSVTGNEESEFYLDLPVTNRNPVGDQGRQINEMMIFLSQVSFLSWIGRRLHLDISQTTEIPSIMGAATPVHVELHPNADAAIIGLATVTDDELTDITLARAETAHDLVFTEGKRVRSTHLRLERSSKLRNHFLNKKRRPILCDMCKVDNDRRYPWTTDLVEIHHLLPLASSVAIQRGRTSVDDIVPLCPSCHRSIHVFYRNWLRDRNVYDFHDKQQAYSVYNQAKQQIWLG